MKTKSRISMHFLLGSMAKEEERRKFQKMEWMKKGEKVWRLVIAMSHHQRTSPLGLKIMSNQTINFIREWTSSFSFHLKI